MGKFSKVPSVTEIVREDSTSNYEGGLAYRPGLKTQLMKMIASSMVNENKFYSSGNDHDKKIIELIHTIAKEDPEFILKLAVFSREVLNLRSAPVMLLGEYANSEGVGVPKSRQYVARTIQRVDEITELLAYQLKRNAASPRKANKIPMVLKNGVGLAFNKFDEYQFAKYNRKGSVTLKDAIFISHPKPKDEKQQALFDKIIDNELAIPETWETYISKNGSSKESWSYIAPKLPIFALVRNLRNLLQNEVPTDLYINKLRNKEVIKKSRMFPFRFYSAYKMVANEVPASMDQREVLDALEDAIELSIENIEKIPGKTAIFVDLSGSMRTKLSARSMVTYLDVSSLFGAIADRICEKSVVGVFGQDFAVVNTSKSAPTLTKMKEIKDTHVGHSTNAWKAIRWLRETGQEVDRVMVFSDEQVYNSRWGGTETLQEEMVRYRREQNPNAFLHSIDLAGYETTISSCRDRKSVV